jgi:hypothetical protein
MTNLWTLIKEWLALSAQKQLQAFLALVVSFSAYIVIHYERKLSDKDAEIKELNRVHSLENRNNRIDLENCFESHIKYVEKSSQEFLDMYKDVQKIKEKK